MAEVRLGERGQSSWLRPGTFAIGIVFCILGFLLFRALDNNPFDDLRFEQSLWREDETCMDGSNRRGLMVMDFRRRFLKAGLTEEEVMRQLGWSRRWTLMEYKELLGKRPRIYFNDLTNAQATRIGTVLSYYLGEELNMLWGIDRANLYLFFDQNHHYLGCRISWY